ncbi:DUF4363 family protein [Clostridium sp. NSJ-6]|uniref:DUF4363 family protein n=1 Tax=Clostridium hominis TaxID=2763036 RepID=A0ABR7D9B5_9CLOT|nr:DUF4363 family protein [Clostridium hominis]MDU2672701.1 DUF4363 family protein [Clostridium sp.]
MFQIKNSLISLSLFLVLIIFLFYADFKFKELCTDIVNICDEMEDSIKTADSEVSFQKAMDLFDMIQERGSIAAIYINHMDYDVMLNEALKLSVYLENDDESESEASLHLLKYSTKHMKELQVPNIENIF